MNHVNLTAIQFDSATQVRAEINNEVVNDYAEQMRAGAKFPPADLFQDSDGYFIGDGWHRLLAAQKNGDVTFPCEVHAGGRREAIKFALSANAKHGMPRTNADKRRSVEIALREFGNMSDREIARICAVNHHMVSDGRRRQVGDSPTSEKRLGADGKIYPATMRHEPRGEVEPREPAEDRPPIGGTLTEIEETARQRLKSVTLSRGLMIARTAITHLETIQPNDKERSAALDLVHTWVTAQLKQSPA